MRRGSWSICVRCEGEGKIDNPAFSNGFSASEWNEEGVEFREDYMAGVYDVVCPECKGEGKVREMPDSERYDVDVWEERDRLIITFHDVKTGETHTWADEDAREMFEDGFFMRGKQLEASVIEYVKGMR